LGIPPESIVLLTIGRFVADKGYRELAAAAAILLRQIPHLRFIWVAPVFDGEDGVMPSSLREEYGIAHAVIQLSYQQDVTPLYHAADLLVHPSHREGVPRVLIEAAAVGLPIAASDIPGCREVVTHGVSGVLFRPNDATALANALRDVLADPATARVRAKVAAADVRARFDQDALTERIWRVYRELEHRGAA
jgi:glycosyltransferase involved in cell wall biosynthesis